MNGLLAARAQMAMSLMFHIVFAVAGMAMPLMMVIAEWRWLRSGDQVYLTSAMVISLDQFPEQDWPAVPVVHMSLQVMVGCGFSPGCVRRFAHQ